MYEFMHEYRNERKSGQKTCNIILRLFAGRGVWPVKCYYIVSSCCHHGCVSSSL